MYAKPFQPLNKKQLRIVTFLLCLILATSIIVPTYADEDDENVFQVVEDAMNDGAGYVTDSIMTGMGSYVIDGVGFAGELFIKLLTVSFSPSINPLLNIEKGLDFSTPFADDVYYEGASIENSFTIMSIWEFAFMFGIITCTLLMFFYLFMCLVGQQEQIRDTPFMLVVKYLVSLFMIYTSKYFITAFIDFFNDMWTNLVLTKDITTPESYTAFLPIWWENGDFREGNLIAFGVKIIGNNAEDILPLIPGMQGLSLGAGLIILIFALYFGWKIIKEFMKLLLEIVERYFVLFFLLAFFPALASTFVSNNSKKIFYAYIKMLYSQGFLLLINTIFMAIFFKILLVGGWSSGLINYIGALAFLRICQRIDAYMAQLGINIVQTGAGVMGACGSVFGGALAGMHAMRGADRTRKNLGASLMQKGVASGNYDMFKVGRGIGANMTDVAVGNTSCFNDNVNRTLYNESVMQDIRTNVANGTMDKDVSLAGAVNKGTLSEDAKKNYDMQAKNNPNALNGTQMENKQIAESMAKELHLGSHDKVTDNIQQQLDSKSLNKADLENATAHFNKDSNEIALKNAKTGEQFAKINGVTGEVSVADQRLGADANYTRGVAQKVIDTPDTQEAIENSVRKGLGNKADGYEYRGTTIPHESTAYNKNGFTYIEGTTSFANPNKPGDEIRQSVIVKMQQDATTINPVGKEKTDKNIFRGVKIKKAPNSDNSPNKH